MNGSRSSRMHSSGASRWKLPLLLLVVCVLLVSLGTIPATAQGPTVDWQVADEQAEANYHPTYLNLATGQPGAQHSVYPWPFALESIGHLIQSYQNYGSPYFHHGVDIMTPAGTEVIDRSGGQVINIENYNWGDLYWEVAVLDPEGYIWQFHHIDHYTIPQLIWDKFAEYQADPIHGGFIPADTYIGNIVWWPVGYPCAPTDFHHTHLNILGAGGVYLNALEFQEPLNDAQSPEVQAIGLLVNHQVYPGNSVSGTYSLYVHARDLVLASSCYWLPPYETDFSIDGGPTYTVWRFDNLPGGADDFIYVHDFYVVPPTCGDYDCNEFYIDLGFTTSGERQFTSEPGQHMVTVTVKDYAGNPRASTWTYTVVGNETIHVGDLDGKSLWTPRGTWNAKVQVVVHNGSHTPMAGATVSGTWSAGGTSTCVTNLKGRCVVAKKKLSSSVPSVVFTVTGVTLAGYTYNPAANHDPDGSSDGTHITVYRPQ